MSNQMNSRDMAAYSSISLLSCETGRTTLSESVPAKMGYGHQWADAPASLARTGEMAYFQEMLAELPPKPTWAWPEAHGAVRAIVAALGLNTLGVGAHSGQAQGFSFTSPVGTALNLHPGDSVSFAGTFKNTGIEEINAVTISIVSPSAAGKFSFASPFFGTAIAATDSRNSTGTLKVLNSAPASTTSFYLDANGTGADTQSNYDYTSAIFKVNITPSAVPEVSTFGSFGLLLVGLGFVALKARMRRQGLFLSVIIPPSSGYPPSSVFTPAPAECVSPALSVCGVSTGSPEAGQRRASTSCSPKHATSHGIPAAHPAMTSVG